MTKYDREELGKVMEGIRGAFGPIHLDHGIEPWKEDGDGCEDEAPGKWSPSVPLCEVTINADHVHIHLHTDAGKTCPGDACGKDTQTGEQAETVRKAEEFFPRFREKEGHEEDSWEKEIRHAPDAHKEFLKQIIPHFIDADPEEAEKMADFIVMLTAEKADREDKDGNEE